MFGVGLPELIIIAIVVLIVVGPKRLPDLAKSLGRGLSEFRRAADDVKENFKESLKTDDVKKEVDDFKDSLLFGSKNEQEPHKNFSTAKDERGEGPRKDSTL